MLFKKERILYFVALLLTWSLIFLPTTVFAQDNQLVLSQANSYNRVDDIEVEPDELVLRVGDVFSLNVKIEPYSLANTGVTWQSTNPSVATVDANGQVTAVSAGYAEIIATSQQNPAESDDCEVRVVGTTQNTPTVRDLDVYPDELVLNVGQTSNLNVSIQPSSASNTGVTWQSTNPSVATVDANGQVTAVGAGYAEIIAASQLNPAERDECEVRVTGTTPTPTPGTIQVNDVEVYPENLTLSTGDSSVLRVVVEPGNATNTAVNWTSSNPAVAIVSNSGQVTGISAGTAIITAASQQNPGENDSCIVTVTQASNQSQSNTLDIYRLYSNVTGEHLYTSDSNEAAQLSSNNWNFEGIGWKAPKSGQGVYRLYNAALQTHLYTTDLNEVNTLTAQYGWTKDFNGNPLFYSGGNIPVYRLYSSSTGLHHLTTDENEYNTLATQGWTQEGVVMFAIEK